MAAMRRTLLIFLPSSLRDEGLSHSEEEFKVRNDLMELSWLG